MLTHHPNVSRVLWHVRIVFNRESAFFSGRNSVKRGGKWAEFWPHRRSTSLFGVHCFRLWRRRYVLSYSVRCIFVWLSITIPIQHSTCKDPIGRAAFAHEINSFGNDPREDLAILADCCQNYEREEASERNSAGMFFFTHESASWSSIDDNC